MLKCIAKMILISNIDSITGGAAKVFMPFQPPGNPRPFIGSAK
jgi:hypothetical protein